MPDTLEVMGIPVALFSSYEHVAQCVGERIRAGIKTFCVAVNPEKIHRAQQDRDLHELLTGADFHICDGIGAALAARLLHGRKVTRITGVALFLALMKAAEREGWQVFLLGASEESNKGAYEALMARHPGLRIAGRRNGYFKDDEPVIEEINASGAQLLFVAMGSPRQEQWITRHREKINAPFCMGVGGTLDVVSGRVKWAPAFFRRTGSEWLYRLICEPKRWRRQLVLPQFAFEVLKVRFNGGQKILNR